MSSKTLQGIRSIEELDLDEKNVFIRVDFNVPMENGVITDDNRIRAALPTIRFALDKGARILLASHLGRPKGKVDPQYSMEPVGEYLSRMLDLDVVLIDELRGDAPKALFKGWKDGQVLLLENLRFDPDEEKNGRDLALAIAEYTDVYINDAFGASHRAHSSIVALPQEVRNRGAGFLMKQEIEFLDKVIYDYEAPFVTILGGAKVSDKIGVIENLIDKVDVFLVGGAMAYTFQAAQKLPTGSSLVEQDKVKFAGELIERVKARDKKLMLPLDHVIVPSFDRLSEAKITEGVAIPEGWMGVDIGPKTQAVFREEIKRAKTIFWNGPMGVFEKPALAKGTFAVAAAMAENQSAVTVVGGGDSAAAAKASGFADKMKHISTGGGASLEYLQGDKLPGVEALRR
ncbi:MAG: phosphoglycerate kinase [Bdellovibrionales bacterium]|nr:phosphoglycerate kinase [Bdellovibrionales bacterium]